MINKRCLVTGASSGHGKAVASALAQMGATVILGCRRLERAELVRSELIRRTGNESIHILALDLASQHSVCRAADRFLSGYQSLDVLVNNAGAWWAERRLSPDGIELVWATNVVNPRLLTQLLLPALAASKGGRIVNVASAWAGGLDLTDVEFVRRPYSGIQAYQAGKQAIRMLTWSLASQLNEKPIVANAICPGFMRTALGRNAPILFRIMLGVLKPFQRSPERGAETAVWLASSPDARAETNRFFVNRRAVECRFRDPSACARWTSCARPL